MWRAARRAAVLLSFLAAAAHGQRRGDIACGDPGDREVRQLRFIGNTAHTDFALERGIITTPSTWWRRNFFGLGQKYCLDSLAVVDDSARIDYLYKRTGYPDVRVRYAIRPAGAGRVVVDFHVEEGAPMLMDSVTVRWDPSFPVPDSARYARNLPIRVGDRFDITVFEAARDSLRRRLHDNGYPQAEVLRNYDTREAEHRASVTFDVLPGPRQWIGRINIPAPIPPAADGRPRIDTARVRANLGVREGDLYNESALSSARRGLFNTDAFRFVGIALDSASLDDGDSLVTINVSLAESQLIAVRGAIGWANLDCLRAQLTYTNYNFLGLNRLDLNTRVSKVGTSEPTGWARGICTRELLEDEVSDTLNYYAGVTFTRPALFGLKVVPSVSVYGERRSEFRAYLRDTPIGVIASALQGTGTAMPMTWSYQLEYGRTAAEPAFFCAVFNVCESEVRQRLERYTRSAVVGWAATRGTVTNLSNPTTGWVARLDLRHASPVVGGQPDASFNRATVDVSWYRPVWSGALALRFRAGTVFGSQLALTGAPSFIPVQERLYAGGPNSVRGFRQNEMGPAIYVPLGVDSIAIDDTLQYWRANIKRFDERAIVPSGGDNLVVANAELRLRSPAYPEILQYALFVDAGQVWNSGRTGASVTVRDVQITPGIGLRVFTPVGPIRVDVGYNRYRRAAGPAYISEGLSGNLICVSPDNTLRVRLGNEALGIPATQEPGECPASYRPKYSGNFFRQLTFQFSIGQPF